MKTLVTLGCIASFAIQVPAIAQTPPVTRETQLETAERARAAGDFAQARETLESLLAQNPDDPDLLRRRQWVADIVYFPRETELLRRARLRGCRVLPGGGMAIYQAVRAFHLFTEREPDPAEMGRVFAAYA